MGEVFHHLEQWVTANDVTIDLVTLWALTIGFAIKAVVKGVGWWVLRGERDRTAIGYALKREKLAEVIESLALSALYGMTLYAYYQMHQYGVWERITLRLVLIIGIVGGTGWGTRLAIALLGHNRHPEREGGA